MKKFNEKINSTLKSLHQSITTEMKQLQQVLD